MPTQTTSIYSTGTAITFAANGETWTVDPGVTLSRANGTTNGPTVSGASKSGITLVNNGYIFNGGTGSYANDPPVGVGGFFAGTKIVNSAGAIIAADAYAINSRGTVENAGTIIGGLGAVEGAGLVLENSGQILGRIGVLAHDGGTIQNSGSIQGDFRGITVSNAGNGKTTVIDNAKAGVIQGGKLAGTSEAPGAAIYSNTTNAVAVNNEGLIDGKIAFQSSLADKIVNVGSITGDTRLGSGNDNFTFAGGTQGTVFGEAGADRFDFVSKLAPKKTAPEIGDFTPGEDTIGLSRKLFKGIGKEGQLKDKFFDIGKKAKGDTKIIYDPKTGDLDYKAKGGDASQKLVAHLATGLDLSASDIFVIA